MLWILHVGTLGKGRDADACQNLQNVSPKKETYSWKQDKVP